MNKRKLTTFGGILIKLSLKESRGKEEDFKKFLIGWNKKVGWTIKDRNICTGCKENRKCECKVLIVATLTGFFDFFLGIQVSDIGDLEHFVLKCLRGNEKGRMISETQTLGGYLHYQRQSPT